MSDYCPACGETVHMRDFYKHNCGGCNRGDALFGLYGLPPLFGPDGLPPPPSAPPTQDENK